jgi:hypothetical protein
MAAARCRRSAALAAFRSGSKGSRVHDKRFNPRAQFGTIPLPRFGALATVAIGIRLSQNPTFYCLGTPTGRARCFGRSPSRRIHSRESASPLS